MPQSKEQKAKYMKDFMARKRGTNTDAGGTNRAVSPSAETVSPVLVPSVTPVPRRVSGNSTFAAVTATTHLGVTPARQALRDRLAALEAQYRVAQRAQDWAACRRINEEREPLFVQLWELERELPESERWWFPARVINDDRTFARK